MSASGCSVSRADSQRQRGGQSPGFLDGPEFNSLLVRWLGQKVAAEHQALWSLWLTQPSPNSSGFEIL